MRSEEVNKDMDMDMSQGKKKKESREKEEGGVVKTVNDVCDLT